MDFLNHPAVDRIIEEALQEDIGAGDHTSLATLPAHAKGKARCLVKSPGIIAGVELAKKIFSKQDSSVEFSLVESDGTTVQTGEVVFFVEGPVYTLLTCERLVLNCMQRMSGIATYTHQVVELLKGTTCRVLDTRKTTPLIRHLEKWAVHIGGGMNHRFGLYDMILIKDNHIDYCGGIRPALEATFQYLSQHNLALEVEIEARTLADVEEILGIGRVQRILLDNMNTDTLKKAVQLIQRRIPTEASGNISLENVRAIAETGVDFVSMGALTHSIKSMDISLKAC